MCAAAAMFAVSAVSQNLFTNGDMEAWDNANSPFLPDGYVLKSGVATTEFSKVPGRNGSANALRIQKAYYGTGNASDRIFSPYITITSLSTAKTYRLSLWVKGTGRIQYMYVLASQSSINGIRQDLTTASTGIDFDYADWTEVSYTFNPDKSGYKNIMFIICGRTTGETSDAYIDDISIQEYISDDATLKKIAIQDPVNSGASYDFALPGFAPATINYTVPLWFGADTVPDLKIEPNVGLSTYVIDNDGSNAFVAGAKTKEVTIKVTAESGATKDYTVTFDRTNYVVGFFRVTGTIDAANTTILAQFSDIKGLYGPGSTNATFHNDYWGYSSIRPYGSGSSSSGGQAYLVTKPLVNGAGTISFWTGALSATFPSETTALDSLYLKLSVTTDGTWTDLKEWQVDTTALHGQWTKMEYDIKSSDPNTQIKLEYRRGTGVAKYLPIDIDDIFITPWTTVGMDGEKIKPFTTLNIYPQGQAVVVAEKGRYMIYTANGQLIASGNNTSQAITIPVKSGLYIAKSGNQAKKLIVK